MIAIIVKIGVGAVLYLGFVLALARMLSYKWHPDRGAPFYE